MTYRQMIEKDAFSLGLFQLQLLDRRTKRYPKIYFSFFFFFFFLCEGYTWSKSNHNKRCTAYTVRTGSSGTINAKWTAPPHTRRLFPVLCLIRHLFEPASLRRRGMDGGGVSFGTVNNVSTTRSTPRGVLKVHSVTCLFGLVSSHLINYPSSVLVVHCLGMLSWKAVLECT